MLDLELISIWEAKKPAGIHVDLHSHQYHELVYYRHGNGKTTIGGRTHTFFDACFAVIPPHTSHGETHHTGSVVTCLEFSGTGGWPPGFAADGSGTVYRVLQDILYEAARQPYGYRDMLCVKLNELYWHILRNENAAADEKSFDYIINYITENVHEKFPLADCARQLHISYDHFRHVFKKLTGYSPQQFRIKQRLLASEKLLISSQLNCTEIACRCGFSTSAQYAALFKREYGLSPLQFRRLHQ